MLKPICLLFTGLFAAGNLFAQTEPNKSPAGPDAAKPPTVHDPAKPSTEQSPPPAVAQSPATANTSTDAAAKPRVNKNPPPLDLKNMDPSIKPSDDFYLYANGGWMKSNPIPPEFSRTRSRRRQRPSRQRPQRNRRSKKPRPRICRRWAISTPAE